MTFSRRSSRRDISDLNTDLNFSTNKPAKFGSTDKYLYAVQGGQF